MVREMCSTMSCAYCVEFPSRIASHTIPCSVPSSCEFEVAKIVGPSDSTRTRFLPAQGRVHKANAGRDQLDGLEQGNAQSPNLHVPGCAGLDVLDERPSILVCRKDHLSSKGRNHEVKTEHQFICHYHIGGETVIWSSG